MADCRLHIRIVPFYNLIARIISRFPGGPGSLSTLNPQRSSIRLTEPFAQ
jgi:hypothetical protein